MERCSSDPVRRPWVRKSSCGSEVKRTSAGKLLGFGADPDARPHRAVCTSLAAMQYTGLRSALFSCCLLGLTLGCGTSPAVSNDAGVDAGSNADAGVDAGGNVDAGQDAGSGVDAGADGGHNVNVCGAASGTVAWTASIPAATTSLVPTDIVAGSTNDVVVGDINNGSVFEQHRWNSSGALLSSHHDAKGGYAGTLFPSNLVLDPQNDIFYGLVLTGLPQGSNFGASVTFTRLAPDGSTVFTHAYVNALPASSGQPSVLV